MFQSWDCGVFCGSGVILSVWEADIGQAFSDIIVKSGVHLLDCSILQKELMQSKKRLVYRLFA